MTIEVRAMCRYYSGLSLPPDEREDLRDAYWDSNKFVRAIKGENVKGWATVPVNGTDHKLDDDNKDQASLWFAKWATPKHLTSKASYVLIPIPSSDTVVGSSTKSRALTLAEHVARAVGGACSVWNVLRWEAKMIKSRAGGTRDASTLFRKMVFVHPLDYAPPLNLPYVIIDDVVTRGGHIQAAAKHLRNHHIKVAAALCVATTVQDMLTPAFQTRHFRLDDLI